MHPHHHCLTFVWQVTLHSEGGVSEGTTGSDGTVSLCSPSPGNSTATITATLDGYQDYSRTYTIFLSEGEFYFYMSPNLTVNVAGLNLVSDFYIIKTRTMGIIAYESNYWL